MEFTIKTGKREEIIDITEKVEKAVEKLLEEEKKIVCNRKGNAVLIFTPHTTCSIIINEISNKDICEDLLGFLRTNIPKGKWKHNCQEKNGDSHIKASILGSSQIIPIENGKLQLGTWQKIGLIEFDGPRERRTVLKII